MAALRLSFGMGIERDILFEGAFPISVYAEAARRTGSITTAERVLHGAARSLRETGASLPPLAPPHCLPGDVQQPPGLYPATHPRTNGPPAPRPAHRPHGNR